MNTDTTIPIHATGEATGFIPAPGDKGKPITVIGTNSIRAGFDAKCLQQALNSRGAPGVTDLVLNPDAHAGYGAPVGCVMVSPSHIYPGPVGVDIKCSMSFLQMDLPADQLASREVRRALIEAIAQRTPTGPGRGSRHAFKARKIGEELGFLAATEGASPTVCHALGIPLDWASRCEDAAHVGHDETKDSLALRLERHLHAKFFRHFGEKVSQLGSFGGGTTSANARLCTWPATTARATWPRRSDCATGAPDSSRTAGHAASAMRSRWGSSVRSSGSSPSGASRSLATTASWSTRRSERPRPTPTSTTSRSGRTSPR